MVGCKPRAGHRAMMSAAAIDIMQEYQMEMDNKRIGLLKLEKLEGSATRTNGNRTGQITEIPFRL